MTAVGTGIHRQETKISPGLALLLALVLSLLMWVGLIYGVVVALN